MLSVLNPATERFEVMSRDVCLKRVVQTALDMGWSNSMASAEEQVKALLQWLAAVPEIEYQRPLVMLTGPVDDAFHSFILNTDIYGKFCRDYVGTFVNHRPADDNEKRLAEEMKSVPYTIELLEGLYGEHLHPLLKQWKSDFRSGLLTIDSVSCGQSCP